MSALDCCFESSLYAPLLCSHVSTKGTGTNAVTSTNCGSATTCAVGGASAYTTIGLTQSTTTGKFAGTITTNTCNGWAKSDTYSGVAKTQIGNRTPNCFTQTIPDKTYTAPAPLNILNTNGYSLRSGELIYSNLDNGFNGAQPVTCNTQKTTAIGTCEAGTDVVACEHALEYQCGSGNVNGIGISDCGGHATPYHLHAYMACDYDSTSAGHSDLVGVMADGTGLYGKYESTGTYPTDLDACGGHYGPVPSTDLSLASIAGTLLAATGFSLLFPAITTNVYHYHLQDKAPWVPACWGPVADLATAQQLYVTANTGCTTTTSFCTSDGLTTGYKLRCPPVSAHASIEPADYIPRVTRLTIDRLCLFFHPGS